MSAKSKDSIVEDGEQLRALFEEIVSKLSKRGKRDAVLDELKNNKKLRDRFRDQLIVLQCDCGLPGYRKLVRAAVARYDRDCTIPQLGKYESKVNNWYYSDDDLKDDALLEYLWDYVYENYPDHLDGILVDLELEQVIFSMKDSNCFEQLPEGSKSQIFENTRCSLEEDCYQSLDDWDKDKYFHDYQNGAGGQILIIAPYPNAECNQVHLFICSPFFYEEPNVPMFVEDYYNGFSYVMSGRHKFMLKSKLTGDSVCGYINSGMGLSLEDSESEVGIAAIQMDRPVSWFPDKYYFLYDKFFYEDLPSTRDNEIRWGKEISDESYSKLEQYLNLFKR